MNRRLWPLAALAVIALIGAGCGSNGPSETGAAGNTGVASNTGAAGNTGTAVNKRTTHQDKIAPPSSAASSPSPGVLPRSAGSSPSPAGVPGSAGSPPPPAGRLPMSTQSPHAGERHD